MEEWSDSVKLAIDVLVACVIIVAMLVCGNLSKQIMSAMDREQAVSADVRDYRVQRLYDDKECYTSDIINLILEYQGEPAVTVEYRDGTTLEWSRTNKSTALSSTSISEQLRNVVYVCSLDYDANNSIRGYVFEEV